VEVLEAHMQIRKYSIYYETEFGINKKDKYEVEGNDQQEKLIFASHCNFDSARVWNALFPFLATILMPLLSQPYSCC